MSEREVKSSKIVSTGSPGNEKYGIIFPRDAGFTIYA
jgi:hypothetical protein